MMTRTMTLMNMIMISDRDDQDNEFDEHIDQDDQDNDFDEHDYDF